jgi:hypothetical protein
MKREHLIVVACYVVIATICALLLLDDPDPQPENEDWNGYSAPWWPRLYGAPPGGDVLTVQVNAGPGTWQIKRIAKALDLQVDGVIVRTSGDCAEVDLCVTVAPPQYFSEEQQYALLGQEIRWNALTTYPSDRERVIYLNQTTERWHRPLTAAHEMGHVFGLDHHQSRGVTSIAGRESREMHPSEIALLNQYYGVTP